ncbi:MAG: hypothetical protein FAF05_03245 [Epsilonproteobacteria bacterium]|nr:hypothetical protein [Campylobacterota bacterium]
MKNVITTDIILVDIINFSTLPFSQQLEVVTFLTKSYKRVIEKIFSNSHTSLESLILGFISTGDGFYCILDPKLKGYGTFLGLSFNCFSDQISKKYPYFHGLKIAVHTGNVAQFTDILGNTNFIGEGLNDCSRYIEFKNFTISTVMVSDVAYKEFKKFLKLHKDLEMLLIKREFKHSSLYTFNDKHGKRKKGYLVWMRKSGIITLPKLISN